MKQFLIVKTSSIGDVLQSFPVITYLKAHFPRCSIDWVAEKSVAPLLEAHPQLDRILTVDTKLRRRSLLKHRKAIMGFYKEMRKRTYDAIFDLQGNTKSGLITAFAKGQKKVGYSWSCVAERPNFFATNVHIFIEEQGSIRSRYIQLLEEFFGKPYLAEDKAVAFTLTEEEKRRLERLLQLGFERPRLMICFGSIWPNKRLPKRLLEQFLSLVHEKLNPTFFFIYKTDEEKQFADHLERIYAKNSHAVGDLSLPLWQHFMDHVECVITCDSAALHLCSTTKTPSFSVFGPSSSHVYKPLGENHEAFQGACPYGIEFDKRCPNLRTCKTGACIQDINPEILFREFQKFWDRVSASLLTTV